jgi:hypothetical protein
MNYPRYAIVFLAVALGAAALVKVLQVHVDSTLGSSMQVLVPAMVAAAIEGQQHAKRHKRKPATGPAWTFAWLATALALVLNLGLAFLSAGLAPEFARLAAAPVGSQAFWVLLCVYAGGYLISNRLFLGLGAGSQLNTMRSRGEIE